MITTYLDKALRRARYRQVDGGVFCATVPGLQGVIATGPTLEACREQLAEAGARTCASRRRIRGRSTNAAAIPPGHQG